MNECRYHAIDVCETGTFKKFHKILYCLADRAAPLLTVHCAVGFSRVSLFVFCIQEVFQATTTICKLIYSGIIYFINEFYCQFNYLNMMYR